MDQSDKFKKPEEIALLLLRIVAGFVFFQAGAMIVLGWFPVKGMPVMPFAPMTQTGIGGILELVGGLLVLMGLGTRPVALILSGEMAVAYFQFHQPNGMWPNQNMGTPAVLFCFIFLYLAVRGAGAYSVDGMLKARKAA